MELLDPFSARNSQIQLYFGSISSGLYTIYYTMCFAISNNDVSPPRAGFIIGGDSREMAKFLASFPLREKKGEVEEKPSRQTTYDLRI